MRFRNLVIRLEFDASEDFDIDLKFLAPAARFGSGSLSQSEAFIQRFLLRLKIEISNRYQMIQKIDSSEPSDRTSSNTSETISESRTECLPKDHILLFFQHVQGNGTCFFLNFQRPIMHGVCFSAAYYFTGVL